MKKTYVVIGASAAGIGAITKIRQKDAHSRVICISDEKEFPYNKCFLVDYMTGDKTKDQLYTKKKDFFSEKNIELFLNTRVISVDKKNKKVVCDDGSLFEYTKLLLAVGGNVHIPRIENSENIEGIVPFYNLNDTEKIISFIKKNNVKNVVVMGAGLSGLECLDALLPYGVFLHLVDRADQVLQRQIQNSESLYIQEKMNQRGINCYFEETIEKVISKDGYITDVVLSDKKNIRADLLICALGARPNTMLSQDAELRINDTGLEVNQWLQTSDSYIYAAGDIISVYNKFTQKNMRSCTWPDAFVQGMTAGGNMVEHIKPYTGVSFITTSHFFGMSFYVAGVLEKGDEDTVVCERNEINYKRIILDKNRIVKGFVLIGTVTDLSHYKRSLLTGVTLDIPL